MRVVAKGDWKPLLPLAAALALPVGVRPRRGSADTPARWARRGSSLNSSALGPLVAG